MRSTFPSCHLFLAACSLFIPLAKGAPSDAHPARDPIIGFGILRSHSELHGFNSESDSAKASPRTGVLPLIASSEETYRAKRNTYNSSNSSAPDPAKNACDLNNDGVVDNLDVNLAVTMTLVPSSCTANVDGPGVCNCIVVQRVVDAAMGGTCIVGDPHSVTLTWTASTSANIVGYNVYRGTTSGGPYSMLDSSLVAGTSYNDLTVAAGQVYYYVTTAVDSNNNESAYSNEAQASIPSP
jgi:hypothetical protein